MTHLPLAKHNRPIRRITSDRRRDGEPARQFRIDQYLVPAVEILGKSPLHIAIREHIVLNRLLRLVCLGVGALLRRKDTCIVAALDRIVLDVIDDACRLLLEDEPRHCADKLLRIAAVACKHLGLNPLQNLCDRAPRERRPRCNAPDQIIRHRTSLCAFQRARPTLAVGKAHAVRHHAHIQIRLLTAIGDRVLETADTQLGVDMVDGRPYELSRVK